jgi:hypothetical protein
MCNCNKTVKPRGYITQARIILRQMWQNTQSVEKPSSIKKINKT